MRRLAPLSLIGLLLGGLWLTALSGCSSDETFEQPTPLTDIKAKVELKSVWDESIGNGDSGQLLFLKPYITDKEVFAVSADGELEALTADKGDEIWDRDLDTKIIAGVGADDNQLYVVTESGQLLALSRKDGKEVWRRDLPDEVLAAPQSNGDSVVVQTIDGKVLSYAAKEGKKRWEYDSVVPVLSFRGTAQPYVTGDTVLAALANGDLVALDANNGTVLWQYTVGVPNGRTELERLVDIDGAPLVKDGKIYVVGYQGKVAELALQTGQELWSQKASSLESPELGLGNLYLSTADGRVEAYNLYSKAKVWTQSKLKYRQLTAPVTSGSYILVGDFEGYLHILSQLDGSIVGRKEVDDDGLRVSVIPKNGLIYVYGNGGELVAYRLRELK
ncbi:outer membrane protein assembly factor BamB [Mangrovitalea sediminis]|uniref:outer membrane protein assembly factor BamB n=1 Tax=Mangrovitalea sediminis TaxID=1982043 RepID=UPI000BE50D21|nr:outer membrane protein assembly factor BamB [Mangrovitalea sediminis]